MKLFITHMKLMILILTHWAYFYFRESFSVMIHRTQDTKWFELKRPIYVFLAGNNLIGWYTYSKHKRLTSSLILPKVHFVVLSAPKTRLTQIKRLNKQKKFIFKLRYDRDLLTGMHMYKMPKCRKTMCDLHMTGNILISPMYFRVLKPGFGGKVSDWSNNFTVR